MPAPQPRYYPAFLDLRDRLCLVVGGGKVAERKAIALMRAGARITLVSPTLTPRLEREVSAGRIRHIQRRFREGDLKGAFLVIAATDSEDENRRISEHKDLLVNVVDRPELCSFIVPSSIRRGPLTIAISTSGNSPAMARAIRQDLEKTYGQAFGRYLGRMRTLRQRAVKQIADPKERERFLKSLASKGVLRQLKEGRMPEELPLKRKK